MKKLILSFFLFSVLLLNAQKSDKLRVGEKIPFSRIVLLNQDHQATNIDLPNGKNTTDRFVLVYFYSPEKSIKELISFNSDVERILNKYQNNSCKGASDIEYVTICLEKDFKKWQTLLTETNYNKAKFTGKKTNYLAEDGLRDRTVSAFKVSKTPSLFLVNPKGRLYLQTDSFEVLEKTFANICKVNAAYSTADISGKLLLGEKTKNPLTQHEVYLVKGNTDTIKKTSTDNYGDFVFRQVDTTQNLSIRIEQNAKTKGGPKVYLAKQNGEIVSEFKRNSLGNFEYKLLAIDVEKLTVTEEDDDITMKYKKFNVTAKKDLTVSENIYYESAKYNVFTESEIVLDKVIVILNASSNVKLEVISHTDAQGDDASNLKLSENRSNAVIDYLVSKGIDKARLKGVGKGELDIRNRCVNGVSCSDKEHEYNRRTEFKFIKN
jgi:outer membrane protein OmpA-like peptidoglycan-associated protein